MSIIVYYAEDNHSVARTSTYLMSRQFDFQIWIRSKNNFSNYFLNRHDLNLLNLFQYSQSLFGERPDVFFLLEYSQGYYAELKEKSQLIVAPHNDGGLLFFSRNITINCLNTVNWASDADLESKLISAMGFK